MSKKALLESARQILVSLDLPKAQQNERSALSLLALLNLRPKRNWSQAENPLIGITPIMDWIRDNYNKDYAPNTRETIRRQTIHQFVDAGTAQQPFIRSSPPHSTCCGALAQPRGVTI